MPASDDTVLLRLPWDDARLRRAQMLHRSLLRRPGDLAVAEQLARGYIDYARATGDARFLGRGLAVVEPWLQGTSPPVAALMIQATVLQSRHAFVQSRVVLERILRAEPDSEQAWLTLAAVAQAQGDMRGARHACAHLIGAMDALVAAACIGGLDAATGRARDGYDVIATLLRQEPSEPGPVVAWVQGLLADAARDLRQDALAESHFRAGLAASPGDNFLQADYADFLLERQRPAEVLALIAEQTQSESLLLRRVLAQAQMGSPAAERGIRQLAQQFHDLELRGDGGLYAREHARFALELQHDAPLALRLAREDWAIQREAPDVRILLQAALRAGEPEAARPALDFADETRLEDPGVQALTGQLRQALASHRGP